MVSPLDRKLLRDLTRMRAQVIAIILVVACGVASYVTMESVHASLASSGDAYFTNTRFPDAFVRVQRAPETEAARLREIPGVIDVDTRIVRGVALDVPGLSEPASGLLVSVPDAGQPRMSRLYLRRGRWVAPNSPDEVMVSEAFVDANQLQIGDTLTAVISGRRQPLTIVGVALSPEYIFSIGGSSMWPDDKRFGVMWMGKTAIAAGFDMDGAFNDAAFLLDPGANEDAVLADIDRVMEAYGSLGAYGRDRQVSARFVKDELEQLESYGAVAPLIFLGVAAFLLNVVMSRMIGGQREQIAALKALGYGNLSIGFHYAKLVLLVAAAGSLAGALLGNLMGSGMLGMYHQFFRFPALEFTMQWRVFASAFALSTAAGFVGTLRAVRGAVVLPPAEAMRPAAPERYTKGVLEWIGIGKLLSPAGRIVLRNASRHPVRLATSTLGIALAMAIMISGTFSMDGLDHVMRVNFELAQRDDVTVTFTPSRGRARLGRARPPARGDVRRRRTRHPGPPVVRPPHLRDRDPGPAPRGRAPARAR